jgi:hypothetical protein
VDAYGKNGYQHAYFEQLIDVFDVELENVCANDNLIRVLETVGSWFQGFDPNPCYNPALQKTNGCR